MVDLSENQRKALDAIFILLDGFNYNECKEIMEAVEFRIKSTPLPTKEFQSNMYENIKSQLKEKGIGIWSIDRGVILD